MTTSNQSTHRTYDKSMTTTRDLARLEKGYRFRPFRLDLNAGDVDRYRRAVLDLATQRPDLTPPLAVAAFALREMLAQVDLPPGAIHSGQEIATYGNIPVGSVLVCEATVSQRSVRGGWVVQVIDFEATDGEGGPLVFSARTSVMSPQGDAA
jgi:hypothetical protein